MWLQNWLQYRGDVSTCHPVCILCAYEPVDYCEKSEEKRQWVWWGVSCEKCYHRDLEKAHSPTCRGPACTCCTGLQPTDSLCHMSLTVNVSWLVSTNSLGLSYHEPRGQKIRFVFHFPESIRGNTGAYNTFSSVPQMCLAQTERKAWFEFEKKTHLGDSRGQCVYFLFLFLLWLMFTLNKGSKMSVNVRICTHRCDFYLDFFKSLAFAQSSGYHTVT